MSHWMIFGLGVFVGLVMSGITLFVASFISYGSK